MSFILGDHLPSIVFDDLDAVGSVAVPAGQDDGNDARGKDRGDRGKEDIGSQAQRTHSRRVRKRERAVRFHSQVMIRWRQQHAPRLEACSRHRVVHSRRSPNASFRLQLAHSGNALSCEVGGFLSTTTGISRCVFCWYSL